MFVGCDTGGTFTDFVMYSPDRPTLGLVSLKLSSTPEDPSRAVLQGLRQLCGESIPQKLNHATTVATNALLEKQGGRVAFITTSGFKDMLFLGRGQRANLYSLDPSRVKPPLAAEHCFEITERITANGEPVQSPCPSECLLLAQNLSPDIDALAICLLHSSVNSQHELELKSLLLESFPRIYCSHQVAPGVGEYERGMTTVIAAFLSGKVESYLSNLQKALAHSELKIVHSAGGLITVEETLERPHRLALSGPAAGLRGALAVGQQCGLPNLVTLDMGGTSTDVALLADATLPYSWQTEIEGYPLRAPTLEIHTVGAGGGSLALLNPSGLLSVGPRSAGAQPGPACYGRGGEQATVTDALCYGGFLPSHLGDGGLKLDSEASAQALEQLAREMRLSLDETASGIIEIACSHLCNAVRKVTTGLGHDPSSFTLFPFGGAGPLMACQVAESLGMTSILVPANAGVLSAWGALTAPWEREWSQTIPPAQRTEKEVWKEAFDQLSIIAQKEFPEPDAITWTALLARRYRGQGETLVSGPDVDFHNLHRQRFGFSRETVEVELTEVRLRAQRAPLDLSLSEQNRGSRMSLKDRKVLWKGQTITTQSLELKGFLTDNLAGPLLLFQDGSTVFVAPGWLALGQTQGHILLQREGRE